MASIVLHHTQTLFPALRAPWTRQAFITTLLPAFLAPQKSFNWAMPTLQSLLDLLPPLVLAVPKKKVTHARKANRSSNKGLKDKKHLVSCPACGQPKLAHHLCAECYSSLKQKWRHYPTIYADKEVETQDTREEIRLLEARKAQPTSTPRIAGGGALKRG